MKCNGFDILDVIALMLVFLLIPEPNPRRLLIAFGGIYSGVSPWAFYGDTVVVKPDGTECTGHGISEISNGRFGGRLIAVGNTDLFNLGGKDQAGGASTGNVQKT